MKNINNDSNKYVTANILVRKKVTNDLYDLNSEDVINKQFNIYNTGYIIKNNLSKDVFFKNIINNELYNNNNTIISTISFSNISYKILLKIISLLDNKFAIINPLILPYIDTSIVYNTKDNYEKAWISLNKNEVKSLEIGDIIKLGRAKLKIDRIYTKKYVKDSSCNQLLKNNFNINIKTQKSYVASSKENNKKLSLSSNETTLFHRSLIANSNLNINSKQVCLNKKDTNIYNKEAIFCRVCFLTDSDIKNPLISPCKCTGTMTFIHYVCLKSCLKNKVTIEYSNYNNQSNNINDNSANINNCNCIYYYWSSLSCEICLTEYPKYFKHKQITYYLIDYYSKFEEYVLFDYRLYDNDKKRTITKGTIICNIKENEDITVGRNNNNHIVLKEISVSRNHCSFNLNNGKFSVKNNGSKFGTLYMGNFASKSYNIILSKNNKEINLVCGNVLIKLSLTLKWNLYNLFSCCATANNCEQECIMENKAKEIINDYEYDLNQDFHNLNTNITNINNNFEKNVVKYTNIFNNLKQNYFIEDSLQDIVLYIENVIQIKDNLDNTTNNNSFI